MNRDAPEKTVEDRMMEELAADLGVQPADLASGSTSRNPNTTNIEGVDNLNTENRDRVSDSWNVLLSEAIPEARKGKTKETPAKKNPKSTATSKVQDKVVDDSRLTRAAIKRKRQDAAASKQKTEAESSKAQTTPQAAASKKAKKAKKAKTSRIGLPSKEVQDRFKTLQAKRLLPDKGFDQESIEELEFVREVIESHGWADMCKVKEGVNTTIVKEVYSILYYCKEPTITVRGVDVTLSPESINTLYGLIPPQFSEYEEMLTNVTKEQLDEMTLALGKPGTNWEPHPHYMLRVFKANKLTSEANVWVNFLNHSINPTTHDSTLNAERIVLLYCIMTGRRFNVGDMVYNSIVYCSGRNQGRLYFPGLIHLICAKAGVPSYEDDVFAIGEKWVIDMRSVARLRERGEGKKDTTEVVRMFEDLTAQNSSLLDYVTQQGVDFNNRLEAMKLDLTDRIQLIAENNEERIDVMRKNIKADNKKKQMMKVKIRDLQVENTKLLEQNSRLKKKLLKKKAAAKAAKEGCSTDK